MMGDPTNDTRAAWAQDAINAHLGMDQCTDEEAMRDLLCNLRHLAVRQKLDIEAFWLGSKSVFDEEVAEEIEMNAADAAEAAIDAAEAYHAALRAADVAVTAAAVTYRAHRAAAAADFALALALANRAAVTP